MWYKLARCAELSKQYLILMDNDKAVWKKDLPIEFDKFIEEIQKEPKNNILVSTISRAEVESIKDKNSIDSNKMPVIDITQYDSPNCSQRNASISHIVLHNTACSFQTAINWLCNSEARASAHLILSRKGETACIVPFSMTAWHAGNSRMNHCSIGIEIEATNNQRGMTKEQEEKLVAWIKYFMKRYSIPKENITIHRLWSQTECPVLIWPTNADFYAWRDKWF